MNMQQTSLLAYRDVKLNLNVKQAEVLEALEEISPATNKMVAKHLGWEINRVTPRMLELRTKQKVVEAFRGVDIGGKQSIYWKPRLQQQEAEDTL